MQKKCDELQQSLGNTRGQLSEAQARLSKAEKEAASAETRTKAMEADINKQFDFRERPEKEVSILVGRRHAPSRRSKPCNPSSTR